MRLSSFHFNNLVLNILQLFGSSKVIFVLLFTINCISVASAAQWSAAISARLALIKALVAAYTNHRILLDYQNI